MIPFASFSPEKSPIILCLTEFIPQANEGSIFMIASVPPALAPVGQESLTFILKPVEDSGYWRAGCQPESQPWVATLWPLLPFRGGDGWRSSDF